MTCTFLLTKHIQLSPVEKTEFYNPNGAHKLMSEIKQRMHF